MRLLRALSLIAASAFCIQQASAQGLMESGSVRALSGGLGAGLAGSLGHGRVVQQAYESIGEAQKLAVERTKAINQYFTYGNAYEKARQWNYAEIAYKFVLQQIAKRDGPGSASSLPVLAHLSKVSKAENKLDQAISFQKTVVALTAAQKKSDPAGILNAQRDLSQLFIAKKDYPGAKVALREEVALFDKFSALPRQQLNATLSVYGKVLTQLHEDAEAARIQQFIDQGAAVASGPVNSSPPPTGASSETSGNASAPAPTVTSLPLLSPVSSASTAATGSSAEQRFALPAAQQQQTAEQQELRKAGLAGSLPLPGEVEALHTVMESQKLSPAEKAAIESNVPGLSELTALTSVKADAGGHNGDNHGQAADRQVSAETRADSKK